MHKRFELYTIFFLGFSSGLPFLLILSTLSIWLAEVGISKTMIGLLAWVSVPYTLKFLCGSLVDNFKIPLLSSYFGLRRSWILLAQCCLWLTLIGLGATNPVQNLWSTALFALLVGCSSAIQDIAVEAYRIEILPQQDLGVGASASVLGYRLGMLCSGAGTIFLAAYFNDWGMAYNCIAACMLIGIFTTLLSPEPAVKRHSMPTEVWRSIKSFAYQRDWRIIIPFILSYKVADTVLNTMTMPFLLEIGFNKLEIASVAKTFGIGAMVLGGIVGGLLLKRQGIRQNLRTCVVLQIIASGLFVLQSKLGNNISFLFVSMGVENFTCGMSQIALIAYLSQLCSYHSAAMHYAILSSFASFVRVSFSSLSGWLADQFAWPQFYSLVAISCIPSLVLLVLYAKHFTQNLNEEILTEQPNLINGET